MTSHWGLVPGVSAVSATYDPCRRRLTLAAKGETNDILRGLEFVRDEHFFGGLAFDFMGWVGPAIPDFTPYGYSQPFNNIATDEHFPLENIIVRTAKNPRGEEVAVRWLGLDATPKLAQSKSVINDTDASVSNGADKSAGNGVGNGIASQQASSGPISIPEPIKINVPKGGTFRIALPKLSHASGLNIKFDTKYLTLVDAGLSGDDIFWKFLAIHPGGTQAVATYSKNLQGEGGIGNERIWDIDIWWLLTPPTLNLKSAQPNDTAILSFLGGLNIAVNLVKKRWPDAELYNVECKAPPNHVYPISSAYDIDQLTATFRVGNEGTVRIASLGWWSTWGPPVFTPGLILGNANVGWPVDMGLEEATALLLADPRAPREFWSCLLWQPLHVEPGVEQQPRYSFEMIDTSIWYVGTKDKKVFEQSSALTGITNGSGSHDITVSADKVPARVVQTEVLRLAEEGNLAGMNPHTTNGSTNAPAVMNPQL